MQKSSHTFPTRPGFSRPGPASRQAQRVEEASLSHCSMEDRGTERKRESERTFAFPSEAHDFAHRKASRRVLVVVPLSIAAAGRERLCHKRGRLGERGAGIYRPLFPQPSMQCMFFFPLAFLFFGASQGRHESLGKGRRGRLQFSFHRGFFTTRSQMIIWEKKGLVRRLLFRHCMIFLFSIFLSFCKLAGNGKLFEGEILRPKPGKWTGTEFGTIFFGNRNVGSSLGLKIVAIFAREQTAETTN